MVNATKLPVQTNATATQLAQNIFGKGVTLVGATYSGSSVSKGIYTNGNAVAPNVVPSDSGIILSTGNASSFTNSTGAANQQDNFGTDVAGIDGNARLNAVSGGQTFDGAILEATFVPEGSTLTMQFVFSSDEYLEYVNQGYNDAIAVYVNDVKAELTIGTGEISIDNVNPGTSNKNLFVDNSSGSPYNTEMDGFTLTLTLKAPVIPDQVNKIWFGIADAGDATYDSNLLIAQGSVQTEVIAGDDEIKLRLDESRDVDVISNDTGPDGATLTITHINGIAVVAGDTVTLASGVTVTLNEDGTLSFAGATAAGTENITYKISDEEGITDVGFIKLTFACFTAGQMILTPQGLVPIDDLAAGDFVVTKDRGAQPIRWIGKRTLDVTEETKPILFRCGTFGASHDTRFSPQHRVLVSGPMAELWFGAEEVLVKAKHLVNDDTILTDHRTREVTYYHMLFDRHEIIYADGMASESYRPGPQSFLSFDEATQSEILALFPELRKGLRTAEFSSARYALNGKEAAVLSSLLKA